jgi:hypothetical protein
MRYYLREFCSESKVLWSSVVPVLDYEFVRNSIEGRVNLYIIKDTGVIFQPSGVLNSFRIEWSLP